MKVRPSPLVCALVVWLAFVLGCVPSGRYSQPNSGNATNGELPLELLSHHGTREYGYLIVEGQVRNATAEKLNGIEAVAEAYDASGQFVTSDSALVEYNPLMPGQTSPFKVMIRDNPLIKNYRVNFKEILGGIVPSKDLSVSPPPPKQKKK